MKNVIYKTIDQIISNKFNIGDYVMTPMGPGYVWSIDGCLMATAKGFIQNMEPRYSVYFGDKESRTNDKFIKEATTEYINSIPYWQNSWDNHSTRFEQSELTKIEE